MVETSPARVIQERQRNYQNSAKIKEGNASGERRLQLSGSVKRNEDSSEAIIAKKLQKKPLPSLWRDTSEFLPATVSFLANCGIQPDQVHPTPIGQGFTHIVFSYRPDGMPEKVVKIPRVLSPGLMSAGYHEDQENIALVRKFFGDYAVPTEVRLDNTTGKYLYVQDAVDGKPVTSLTGSQSVRTQLADLARLNREMMRQKHVSMDFLGVPGFLSLLRHQFWSIVSKKSSFDLSNILEDATGKLKLIDSGLIRFDNVPFKQKLISSLGFFTNRVILRLYFGVDIKP